MTWRDELVAAKADGWDVLDWLSAVEEGDRVRVVACLMREQQWRLLSTDGTAGLASVVDLFPSAAWHERETAEMFGIVFHGHPDPRPLLLAEGVPPPLRKSFPLPAREGPWPGGKDPAKPQRSLPTPGTPWV